jgi:hypothetical protein
MPRNISFALTTPQFLDGSKDVTRRMGWRYLRAGDILMAVEKSQGLGKGGKINRLGLIRVVDARREPLNQMCADLAYGAKEVVREGFPGRDETDFVLWFADSHGCEPDAIITRIEFERIASPVEQVKEP